MKTRQVCKHLVSGAQDCLYTLHRALGLSYVQERTVKRHTARLPAASSERISFIRFEKKKKRKKKKDTLGTSSASIVPGRRNAHERSRNLARCMECIYVQGGRPSTNRVASS